MDKLIKVAKEYFSHDPGGKVGFVLLTPANMEAIEQRGEVYIVVNELEVFHTIEDDT